MNIRELMQTFKWFVDKMEGLFTAANLRIDSVENDVTQCEQTTSIVVPVNETDASLAITTLSCETGKYYRIDVPVGTLTVTLPIVGNSTHIEFVTIYMATASSSAITFASATTSGSATPDIFYQKDFEIGNEKYYEVNCLWNGYAWVLSSMEINVPTS